MSLTFRDYQRAALRTDTTADAGDMGVMIPLLGLAGEAGDLLTEYKKFIREGERYRPFADQVSEEIGDILWYLAVIANNADLDLQEVAMENLAKIENVWLPAASQPMLIPAFQDYDHSFPVTQRLPRKLRISLIERDEGSQKKLRLIYNGSEVGDELTDNSHIEDGYRFHDVFHFACGILLGWSPVMRRIFQCKRKLSPSIDVVEDGARALVTEEGVSAVVFNYALEHSMLEGADYIDYELLRTIRSMVNPFEVRTRPLADWKDTILQSFVVWREMIKNGGGVFVGDAEAKTLRYESLDTQSNS